MSRILLITVLGLLFATATRAEPALTMEARRPHVPEGGEGRGRLHVHVDAALRGGIGAQGMIGAVARGNGQLVAWNTRRATGSFDFGLMLSYDNEPAGFAPWLAGQDVSGAGHRLQLTATIGHSFHLGRARRFSLGAHVFGGHNHYVSAYRVRYPEVGVDEAARVSFDRPIVGAELRIGYRISERVGWNLAMGAPFPTESSYVITMAYATTGLSVYIR